MSLMSYNALLDVLKSCKYVILSPIESGRIVAVNALRTGSFFADCQLTVISTENSILFNALIINILRFVEIFYRTKKRLK